VRGFLGTIENLQLVGRNGMHKYNNQDHSMLTAMLAVKNVLGANYDIWEVNVDEQYQEEIDARSGEHFDALTRLASTQPRVPKRLTVRPEALEPEMSE
jgi:hypothetical protein